MFSVSIVTNHINLFNEVDNLSKNLDSWIYQTHPPLEIILADSSKDGPERDAVKATCAVRDVKYQGYPFNYYTSRFSHIMNEIVPLTKGDVILWLCPNWEFKELTWIERMVLRLKLWGEKYIIATDNDRHALRDTPASLPRDWFAGYPPIFPTPHYAYIDNPKAIFYRSCWIPMDTDFDPPIHNVGAEVANSHGLIYWGWEQIYRYKRTILLCRDMKMAHTFQPSRFPFPDKQIRLGDTLFERKAVLP